MSLDRLNVLQFSDYHMHFREGDLLKLVAGDGLELYDKIVAEPNLNEPVTNDTGMLHYLGAIRKATGSQYRPELLMTFQITPQTSAQDIKGAKDIGAFGAKVLPAGVTTNSSYGIEDFYNPRFRQTLQVLEDHHLPLLLHCEKPGTDRFEAEREFLPIFEDIVGSFKYLRVVFEHVSTREGIELVRKLSAKKPGRVFATITLHHATLDWTSVFECDRKTIKNPHLLCKPVLNRPEDRDAVLDAMLSGESCFGFGSDSASHLRERKEGPDPPSGIFTPPEVAYALLAELFVNSSNGDDGRLAHFACFNAAKFHYLQPAVRRVLLLRDPWQVPADKRIYLRDEPEQLPAETRCVSVVPLRAGTFLSWRPQPEYGCPASRFQ